MASASINRHTADILTLYLELAICASGLSFQPRKEGDPAEAQCWTSPPCMLGSLASGSPVTQETSSSVTQETVKTVHCVQTIEDTREINHVKYKIYFQVLLMCRRPQ